MDTINNMSVSIVMPCYNEAEIIEKVIRTWYGEVIFKIHDSEMIIVDDCSSDNTHNILKRLSSEFSKLKVLKTAVNSGHGRTTRAGYEAATKEWIFQVDSDNQFEAHEFWKLYALKDKYDFILGFRKKRQDSITRLILAKTIPFMNFLLFQIWIKDANCPFRLIKKEVLDRFIELIDKESLAPNIMMSILAKKKRIRMMEVPVTHRKRKTGVVSIVNWKLIWFSLKGFKELVTTMVFKNMKKNRPLANLKRALFYGSLKPALPTTLMVEPTNACNFRCISCTKQNSKDDRPAQFMDVNTFERIIGQFQDLNNIVFCGLGEPLFNRDIVKMAQKAKENKIGTIRLTTNGFGLTKTTAKSLMPFLTHINISINGFSPASYAKFNGVDPDYFNKVVENTRGLVALKESSGGSLKVCLSAVLTRQNISNFNYAVKFAKELEADSFLLLQLNDFDGSLCHLKISRDEHNRVSQKLKRDSKIYKIPVEFIDSVSMPRCYLLWKTAYISVDGAVIPCNGYFDCSEWNLLTQNFKDIWHSEDFVEMRKKVVSGKLPYCKSCSNGPTFDNITFPWLYARYIKPVVKKIICRA